MRRFGLALTLSVACAALLALSAAGDDDPPPAKVRPLGKVKGAKADAFRNLKSAE